MQTYSSSTALWGFLCIQSGTSSWRRGLWTCRWRWPRTGPRYTRPDTCHRHTCLGHGSHGPSHRTGWGSLQAQTRDDGGLGAGDMHTFGFTFSVRSDERVIWTRAENSSDGRAVRHSTRLCWVTRSGGLARILATVVNTSEPWTTVIVNSTL